MQGILPMKKNVTPPKEQSALDRYVQKMQIANCVYDGMEQIVDDLSHQIIKSLQPPKKRR